MALTTASAVVVYLPLVLFQFVDGSDELVIGETYRTYEACMVQAEHDVKIMAREAEEQESRTSAGPTLQQILIRCEEFPEGYFPEHRGYVPLQYGPTGCIGEGCNE